MLTFMTVFVRIYYDDWASFLQKSTLKTHFQNLHENLNRVLGSQRAYPLGVWNELFCSIKSETEVFLF